MHQKELLELIHEKLKQREHNLSVEQIKATLDAFDAVVCDAMRRDEKISLAGLGKFNTVIRAARTGRNPATGASIKIPAKKSVVFKVSKKMSDLFSSDQFGGNDER